MLIFDYEDGDLIHTVSDNMAVDFDGNLMMRLSNNMALDMNSGNIHTVSFWLSSCYWMPHLERSFPLAQCGKVPMCRSAS